MVGEVQPVEQVLEVMVLAVVEVLEVMVLAVLQEEVVQV